MERTSSVFAIFPDRIRRVKLARHYQFAWKPFRQLNAEGPCVDHSWCPRRYCCPSFRSLQCKLWKSRLAVSGFSAKRLLLRAVRVPLPLNFKRSTSVEESIYGARSRIQPRSNQTCITVESHYSTLIPQAGNSSGHSLKNRPRLNNTCVRRPCRGMQRRMTDTSRPQTSSTTYEQIKR